MHIMRANTVSPNQGAVNHKNIMYGIEARGSVVTLECPGLEASPAVALGTEVKDVANAGGPVCIRRFCSNDRASLFAAVRESITELCQWMVWCHPQYSADEVSAFIAGCDAAWTSGERYSFAIYDRLDGAILGSVGLSAIDRRHQLANLGYWVRTGRTRRGVATAAVDLAARFAFTQTNLQRLEMIIPVENEASLRVAKRTGATREGTLRSRILLNGSPHDAALFSLVRSDVVLIQ